MTARALEDADRHLGDGVGDVLVKEQIPQLVLPIGEAEVLDGAYSVEGGLGEEPGEGFEYTP